MSSVDIERIYTEYSGRVMGYIRARVRGAADAEDLHSEVFEKVMRKIDGFDPQKASMSTWIFTITRNTVIDFFRRSRPGEELEFGMFAPFRGMLIGSLGPGPDVVNLVSDGIPLEDGTTRAAVRVGEMRDTGELERLLGLLESNYSHFTIGMGLDRLPKGDIDDSAHREGTRVTLRRCCCRGTGIKR